MINNAIISPVVARKEFMDFFGREEEIGDLMALWASRHTAGGSRGWRRRRALREVAEEGARAMKQALPEGGFPSKPIK